MLLSSLNYKLIILQRLVIAHKTDTRASLLYPPQHARAHGTYYCWYLPVKQHPVTKNNLLFILQGRDHGFNSRFACDNLFYNDMKEKCNSLYNGNTVWRKTQRKSCLNFAKIYYLGVRIGSPSKKDRDTGGYKDPAENWCSSESTWVAQCLP